MFITDIFTSSNGKKNYNDLYTSIREYLRAPSFEVIKELLLGSLEEGIERCKRQGIECYPSSTGGSRGILFKGRNEKTIITELSFHKGNVMSIHLTIPFSSRWHAEEILRLVPQELYKDVSFTVIGADWEQHTLLLYGQPQYQGDLSNHPF